MIRVFRVGDGHQRGSSGFTIVELLVVIVVIAIVAAISVVAYSGIQQRAYNTQLISVVKTYRDALGLYKEDGAGGASPYPHLQPGMNASQCLGKGYTQTYAGNSDYCWTGNDGSHRESAVFNALLQPYMPTVPNIKPPRYYTFNSSGELPNVRGGAIFIRGASPYSSGNSPRIEYLLDGTNQNCSMSEAVVLSASFYGATRCVIYLPY